MFLLTITDFHLGMKAWKESDGEDWDVTIARDVFLQSIHDMVSAAPKSGTGILNQLGDFFHWDGLVPMTPTSKHVLTGDDRYSKLVELTINIMTEAVHIMLKKFGKVVIVQAEGNHDLASSVWIRKYMKHRFQDEPRVSVIDNEFPYYVYLHGKTMLGFHHGHRLKMAQLQKLFAAEPRFREMWGKATPTATSTAATCTMSGLWRMLGPRLNSTQHWQPETITAAHTVTSAREALRLLRMTSQTERYTE